MIDSDMGSENETHGAGECFFASAKQWIEGNVSWKLRLYRCVKCNYCPTKCSWNNRIDFWQQLSRAGHFSNKLVSLTEWKTIWKVW